MKTSAPIFAMVVTICFFTNSINAQQASATLSGVITDPAGAVIPGVEVTITHRATVLGVSNVNYSGFGNVLGTESFGRPVTTAGGVFGSGGARAFQLAARFVF